MTVRSSQMAIVELGIHDISPAFSNLCCRCTIGTSIPNIAFGTWTLGNGRSPVDQVDQAIETGFDHIGEY